MYDKNASNFIQNIPLKVAKTAFQFCQKSLRETESKLENITCKAICPVNISQNLHFNLMRQKL